MLCRLVSLPTPARCLAFGLLSTATLFGAQAQAALLRGAGGSVSQDTWIDTYGIVPTDQIVPGSNLVRRFDDAIEMSVSSREPLVFATPKAECFGSIQTSEPPIPEGGGEPDLSGWEPETFHTACTYEFARGAEIHLQGSFENYLEGAIIDLVWNITGNGRSLSWGMDDIRLERSGRNGTVYLDALLPSDMPLGDYLISLTFSQSAGPGMSLYMRGAPSYGGVRGGCLHENDLSTCGTEVNLMERWTISGPRLRDTAGFRVVEGVAEVPLPPTAGLFGLGMAALWLSRSRDRRSR